MVDAGEKAEGVFAPRGNNGIRSICVIKCLAKAIKLSIKLGFVIS